jgi:hypothetical protein
MRRLAVSEYPMRRLTPSESTHDASSLSVVTSLPDEYESQGHFGPCLLMSLGLISLYMATFRGCRRLRRQEYLPKEAGILPTEAILAYPEYRRLPRRSGETDRRQWSGGDTDLSKARGEI